MTVETEAAIIALGPLAEDYRVKPYIEGEKIGALAELEENDTFSTGEKAVIDFAATLYNPYRLNADLGSLIRLVDDLVYARCITALLHRRPVNNDHLLTMAMEEEQDATP
jgi:hypothetical protein